MKTLKSYIIVFLLSGLAAVHLFGCNGNIAEPYSHDSGTDLDQDVINSDHESECNVPSGHYLITCESPKYPDLCSCLTFVPVNLTDNLPNVQVATPWILNEANIAPSIACAHVVWINNSQNGDTLITTYDEKVAYGAYFHGDTECELNLRINKQ